jgi:zinc transport system substrate-binding protein
MFPLLGRALCLLCLFAVPNAGAAARIAVTVKPLHSLVAAVTGDADMPALLLKDGASPHHAALLPSMRRTAQEADVLFYVGEGFEAFVPDLLSALPSSVAAIGIVRTEGLTLFPYRSVRDGGGQGTDPHVWLDADNAKRIVASVAATLSARYPERRDVYADNAARYLRRLDALDRRIAALLLPLKDAPFLAFHDAWQYFDRRYGLAYAGSVVPEPDASPSAKRLTDMRRLMRERGVECVLADLGHNEKSVAALTEGLAARVAVPDETGYGLAPGEDLYPALMETLTERLASCLGG